jgi:hypothetical protein
MTNIDPKLVLNPEGYLGLSALSPAVDASSDSYPAIMDIANVDDDAHLLLDLSGQHRPVSKILKDVGCDEFTTGVSTNHPLSLSEVGPAYLVSDYTGIQNSIRNDVDLRIFPNPANDRFTVEYNLVSASDIYLSIINAKGITVKNLILNQKQSSGNHKLSAEISDLQNGMYFVSLKSGYLVKTIKFVICR